MNILSYLTPEQVIDTAYNREAALKTAELIRVAVVWFLFDWEDGCIEQCSSRCDICGQTMVYTVKPEDDIFNESMCISQECIASAIQRLGRKMMRERIR